MTDSTDHPLRALLQNRIVILDGAMGTNLQQFRPTEADYRGDRFLDPERYPRDLKNNNDILNLTRPELVSSVHEAFLSTGQADILETNTFNATSIAQSDFFMPEPDGRKDQAFFHRTVEDEEVRTIVRDINLAAVALARQAAQKANTGRLVFVAGAIGPMPVTASLSPDVNDPAFRQVTFDLLRLSYRDQVEALLDGGVDTLLVETIFDTLNAKAALFAINEVQEERKSNVPVMISFTITDNAGRTLSGQTVEAFWNSIRHSKPFSVGINCALGADAMRPFASELGRVANCPISIYANAGLPNPLSPTGYDQTPDDMAQLMKDYASSGFLNIVGGCCGTTPEHIGAIAQAVAPYQPRTIPTP
jgi:5-methyltetrahydrofolate--homocysteine methyltransferase